MFALRLSLIIMSLSLVACENFQAETQMPSASKVLADYQQVLPRATPATQQARSPIDTMNLKPSLLMQHKAKMSGLTGVRAVDEANRTAIVQPLSMNTLNSIIVYPFQEGDLYQIYATPLNVTDVTFQAGEQIISVAAGDTVRWQISKTVSGTDNNRVEHLLIKPFSDELDTTLVVTTTQRTYHMLLKATKNTFMASVQWQYANKKPNASDDDSQVFPSESDGLSLTPDQLHLNYKIKVMRGDTPDWLPKVVFNDGVKTYIEFPKLIQSAPTLFIKQSDSGDAAVNYRVVANYYVIDQVISSAELTSGMGKDQIVVDIIAKNPK